MPVKHVLPAVQAAITTLKSQLPGHVAAYNAEAHPIALTAPDDARYYTVGTDTLIEGGFPAVEVYTNRGSLGPFAVNRVAADMDELLQVYLWLERDRGEIAELYEEAAGLTRCVLEVLVQHGAFGPGAEIADEPGAVTYEYTIGPNNPESRDFDRWRTVVWLTFKLEDVTPIP